VGRDLIGRGKSSAMRRSHRERTTSAATCAGTLAPQAIASVARGWKDRSDRRKNQPRGGHQSRLCVARGRRRVCARTDHPAHRCLLRRQAVDAQIVAMAKGHLGTPRQTQRQPAPEIGRLAQGDLQEHEEDFFGGLQFMRAALAGAKAWETMAEGTEQVGAASRCPMTRKCGS